MSTKESDSGQQLESAFQEIKAELAAGRNGTPRLAAEKQGDLMRRRSKSSADQTERSTRASLEHLAGTRSRLASSNMQFNLHLSRNEVIKPKIEALKLSIESTLAQLQRELRIARNLSILTPFVKTTRDRINASVPPLAKRIRHLRIELARHRCHVEILEGDARAGEEDWARTMFIAHQAAAARDPNGTRRASQEPVGNGSVPNLEISSPVEESMGRHLPPHGTRQRALSALPQSPTTMPSTGGENRMSMFSARSISSFQTAFEDPPRQSIRYSDDLPSSSRSDEIAFPTSSGPPSAFGSREPSPSTGRRNEEGVADEEDWTATRAGKGKRISLALVPESSVRKIRLKLKDRASVESLKEGEPVLLIE